MLYNVTLYKNTGFNGVDRPGDASVLAAADSVSVSAVWRYQDKERTTIKIAGSYSDYVDVDYCKIGDAYYIVTNVTNLSEGATVQLELAFDALLSSGGISNISVLGGWSKRVCVSDDTIFSNTIDEPWTPQERLEMDPIEQIGPENSTLTLKSDITSDGDCYGIVLSTTSLTGLEHVAEVYTDAASDSSVVVPTIPAAPSDAVFLVNYRDSDYSYIFPLAAIYNYKSSEVQTGIQSARSLGVESCIMKAYIIPLAFGYIDLESINIGGDDSITQYKQIKGQSGTVTPSDNFKYLSDAYSNIKNNKVYCLFNNFTIYSICSGDKKDYDARDIFAGKNETKPHFIWYADPSPDGRPYIQPTIYHGAATVYGQEAVSGGEWLNLPIAYRQASGTTIANAQLAQTQRLARQNLIFSALTSAAGTMASAISGNISGTISGLEGMARTGLNYNQALEKQNYEREISNNVIPPDVTFPCDPGIQGYLGNNFYITRSRLSANDAKRLDRFLTMYGYAVDKPFQKSDLNGRQYFNYIQTSGAVVKAAGAPLRYNSAVNALFDSGVRIWHTLPTAAAFEENPIIEE